ncbi:hypothetical protein HYC85_017640 [Camellia sinensis]|uniref:Wax synthase domain-containing protein n=1 Tax=Camellia sinensis TaxID=4442 RepID=A0A7J7GRZ8_CAMSI|nr:hypothetical protein HYC85_017640 [Camellia sinensis]
MEGEINNFIVVWIIVFASLCYCHTIGKFIPKGTTRLFAILPIICLFLYLPLNLTTIHLGATTAFFIAWLGNFKLLLFAFGKPPLSSNPPISLPLFILFSTLPIKVQESDLLSHSPKSLAKNMICLSDSDQVTNKGFGTGENRTEDQKSQNTQIKAFPSHQTTKKSNKSPLNYATKIMIVAMLVQVYKYKDHIHPKIILVLYCFHIYFMLELVLAMMAALARALARLELEPQFDEPYLSTSLQDFWGKRWNLMVTSILRPTVYDPVRSISARLIGRKWAPLPAVLATFIVSGVMHELIFYYTGRLKPTWEVSCFFLIHGVCLAAEIGIKKALKGQFMVPAVVSGPAALAFVVVTVKLDGSNFIIWQTQISKILRATNLLGYVDGLITCLSSIITDSTGGVVPNPKFLQWTMIDTHLLSCITATLTPVIYSSILQFHHCSEVWTSLQKCFTSLSRSHVHQLKNKLNSVVKKSNTMEEYLSKIKVIVS